MKKDIRTKLKTLLENDQLVEIYIKKFGLNINMSDIKKVKSLANNLIRHREPTSSKTADVSVAGSTSGNIGVDPVFERLVDCPVCHKKQVVSYILRAKSQFVEETLFLVPRYVSGIGKYSVEDYSLLQTTVCPKCYFASPDPHDFNFTSPVTGKFERSHLLSHPKLLSRLYDEQDERDALVTALKIPSKGLFLRPRTSEVAIAAIKLSISRAEIEGEMHIPYSNYKIGSYYLKIADIEKRMGRDNMQTLEIAASSVEQAFSRSDCPSLESELRMLYLVIAVNIKLGKAAKAGSYLKFFKDMRNEISEAMDAEGADIQNLRRQLAFVDSWEKRTKDVWESRDEAHFWAGV